MGNPIGSRWLRAAVALLLAAAAVGAQPGVALGHTPGTCQVSGSTDTEGGDAYGRWYAGQCLQIQEGTWLGIDGYVRLSTPAWPTGSGLDQDLSDWIGVGDSQDDWVQAGLHSQANPLGGFFIYAEASIGINTCARETFELPMSLAKPNHAFYVYPVGLGYPNQNVAQCNEIFHGGQAWLYQVKFDSYGSRAVAYGWLRGPWPKTIKAAMEFSFFEDYPLYLLAHAGGQRFGLNNSGAYDPGYALNLYNGSSWYAWGTSGSQDAYGYWSKACQKNPSTCNPMPANPYRWSPKHVYNAFTVEYQP